MFNDKEFQRDFSDAYFRVNELKGENLTTEKEITTNPENSLTTLESLMSTPANAVTEKKIKMIAAEINLIVNMHLRHCFSCVHSFAGKMEEILNDYKSQSPKKISNIRKDNLHKISHKLVMENQLIASENLKISNMIKNHHLAKSIADASWYELTRQLDYKSVWYGRLYVKIDTYYPSSQTCNCCGFKNPITKNLTVRDWTCPQCETYHDRDENAADNILAEGKRIVEVRKITSNSDEVQIAS